MEDHFRTLERIRLVEDQIEAAQERITEATSSGRQLLDYQGPTRPMSLEADTLHDYSVQAIRLTNRMPTVKQGFTLAAIACDLIKQGFHPKEVRKGFNQADLDVHTSESLHATCQDLGELELLKSRLESQLPPTSPEVLHFPSAPDLPKAA